MLDQKIEFSDLSPAALGDLKAWLEPWFLPPLNHWEMTGDTDGDTGGGVVFSREVGHYTGHVVTIASDGTSPLTFDTFDSGVALLDLTNPALPSFLHDGWYAITIAVTCTVAMTVGRGYSWGFFMGSDDPYWGYKAECGGSAFQLPVISTALRNDALGNCACFCPAGSTMNVQLRNDDTSSKTFQVRELHINRLSVTGAV